MGTFIALLVCYLMAQDLLPNCLRIKKYRIKKR